MEEHGGSELKQAGNRKKTPEELKHQNVKNNFKKRDVKTQVKQTDYSGVVWGSLEDVCGIIHASLWSSWQSVASREGVILLGTHRHCQSTIQLLFSVLTTLMLVYLSLFLVHFLSPLLIPF